jgi:hypothetical protein
MARVIQLSSTSLSSMQKLCSRMRAPIRGARRSNLGMWSTRSLSTFTTETHTFTMPTS